MKQRNGFVSNSSSSSFVIALDKNPMEMNVEEMRKLLFGEQELFAKYDHAFTTQDLAETVLKDIQYCHESEEKDNKWDYNSVSFAGKMSKKGLVKTISSGYFDGCPGYDWQKKTEADKIREEAKSKGIDNPYKDPKWSKLIYAAQDKENERQTKEIEAAATVLAEPFCEENKDRYIYALEYSDNDGPKGCVLEHGNVFRNIPNIQISHH